MNSEVDNSYSLRFTDALKDRRQPGLVQYHKQKQQAKIGPFDYLKQMSSMDQQDQEEFLKKESLLINKIDSDMIRKDSLFVKMDESNMDVSRKESMLFNKIDNDTMRKDSLFVKLDESELLKKDSMLVKNDGGKMLRQSELLMDPDLDNGLTDDMGSIRLTEMEEYQSKTSHNVEGDVELTEEVIDNYFKAL